MLYKISEIEKIYPDWYKKDSPLPYDDQKFIWENTPLSPEDEQKLRGTATSENVNLNGSVNGGRKLIENSEENITKLQANTRLNLTNWRTPAKEIAFYLEALFGRWEKKHNHWLYIAQHYTPKTIRSVRSQMIKSFNRGDISIITPGAYFTSIIKKKGKRKIFRLKKVLETEVDK